jgi:hypothetical protein
VIIGEGSQRAVQRQQDRALDRMSAGAGQLAVAQLFGEFFVPAANAVQLILPFGN